MPDDTTADQSERVVTDRHTAGADATSTRIVRCVSIALDVPSSDLPPLYDVVDPEAVDVLCPRDGSGNCSLSFCFAETTVQVFAGGDVHVTTSGCE